VSAVKGGASPSPPPPATSTSDWFHSIVAPVASIGGFSSEPKPERKRKGVGDDIAWERADESRQASERRTNAFLGRKGLESWKGPGGADDQVTWPVNREQPAAAPPPAPVARCLHPVFPSLHPTPPYSSPALLLRPSTVRACERCAV